MKRTLSAWGERYLYAPSFFQKLLSCFLWPLSLLYCGIMQRRFHAKRPEAQGIPVISVGNLTVGGSGKTPLVTALASRQARPAIVLRGYGRRSRGRQLVYDGAKLRCDVACSGDEAMLYATLLPHAVVIVSEVREEGIALARAQGCECVFLDDGYGKHGIAKFDIVIDVPTVNNFCLPSGPYRERLWSGKAAYLVQEKRDFIRRVAIKGAAETMVLVTAIARPERLDAYLPDNVVSRYYFPDHHYFSRGELEAILRESGAEALLVTYKDYVKMRDFGLPLALMELTLELDSTLADAVDAYIRRYDDNQD